MENFASFIDYNTARWPEKEVICFEGRRLSNRMLLARVKALAAALADLGIGRGDVVASLLQNCPQCLELILAVNRLGAIYLPLNCRLAPPEWGYILQDSGSKLLVSEPEFFNGLQEILPQAAALAHHVAVMGACAALPEGWLDYEGIVAAHRGAENRPVDVARDEVMRLMYTSGTTAHPKGVPLSYGNITAKTFAHLTEFSLSAEDVTLVCGPLYHAGGLDIPALTTFFAGGRLVLMRKFDALGVLDLFEAERITSGWLATAMLNMIVALPAQRQRDLSALRFLIFGGEKTPRRLIEHCVTLFPGVWLSDGYGSTETSSGDTFNDAASQLSKVGSVGRPIRQLEVRLFDEAGGEVATHAVGEIAVRGPKVFKGYWKNPEATAKAFRGDWYLTGDMGRFDEDGYLYLEDRKKDIIISGGENIASSEVERVLYEHPAVLEAAVVAGPHPRWGEVPVAYVVCKSGFCLDQAEAQSFCAARLAKFKTPQNYHFIEELPRTSSGKVKKQELRKRLQVAEPARPL